jgi:hypothetical protein
MDEANAEIVKKYPIDEAGHFANCQDGKVYVVSQSYLKIYDLTNDTFTMQEKIEFKKIDHSDGWSTMRCYGIVDLGEKYLMLMRIGNTTDSIKTLFSINHDGTEFGLSDLTSDLLSNDIMSIYYDSSKKMLSVLENDYILSDYLYDVTGDLLTIKKHQRSNRGTLTKSYCYDNDYRLDSSQILYSWSSIDIDERNGNKYYYIYPYYLGLSKPVLSVFDNKGDIYLFYKDGEKYEFMRINLR